MGMKNRKEKPLERPASKGFGAIGNREAHHRQIKMGGQDKKINKPINQPAGRREPGATQSEWGLI